MHRDTFCAVAEFAFDSDLLKVRERTVLIALGRYVNSKTKEAFPSNSTLSKITGLSVSTVQRATAGLQEKGVLENKGQRTLADGSLSSNTFRLLIPLHGGGGEGGHPDHLNNPTEEGTKSSNRGLQVTLTTHSSDDRETNEWLEALVPDLCRILADDLIERGLKDAKYRSDAEGEAWIYHMRAFVSGSLPAAASGDEGWSAMKLTRIFETAVRLAPDRIDFRTASDVLPAPKLLGIKADELIGQARKKIDVPEPAEIAPPPSLEELDRRRETTRQQHEWLAARMKKGAEALDERIAASRATRESRSHRLRPQDSVVRRGDVGERDLEFEAEIETLLEDEL